jgi:hypothetical protein
LILTVVDEIKSRFTLEDAIRDFVNIEGLRKSGGRFVGHCPFHSDKTPSWSGRIKDSRWKCFGCNLYGDQIDLVARYLNLDTGEAIKLLANHLGISKNATPEKKAAVRKAILRKQQERIQREIKEKAINRQYKRLCCLERSIYGMLGTIQTEQDLDRPEVVAALKAKERVGFYLDSFLRDSRELSAEVIVGVENILKAGLARQNSGL